MTDKQTRWEMNEDEEWKGWVRIANCDGVNGEAEDEEIRQANGVQIN